MMTNSTSLSQTQLGFWMVIPDSHYMDLLLELKDLTAKQRRKWKRTFTDEKGVRTRIRFDGNHPVAYNADTSKWHPLSSISAQTRRFKLGDYVIKRVCMDTGEVELFEPGTQGYDEAFCQARVQEEAKTHEQSNDHTDPRKKGGGKHGESIYSWYQTQ